MDNIVNYSMTMTMTTIALKNLDAVPEGRVPPEVEDDLQQARMCLQAAQEKLKEVD